MIWVNVILASFSEKCPLSMILSNSSPPSHNLMIIDKYSMTRYTFRWSSNVSNSLIILGWSWIYYLNRYQCCHDINLPLKSIWIPHFALRNDLNGSQLLLTFQLGLDHWPIGALSQHLQYVGYLYLLLIKLIVIFNTSGLWFNEPLLLDYELLVVHSIYDLIIYMLSQCSVSLNKFYLYNITCNK